jgi:alkanesulfonate monooxygenase SsuD/methylene tetrahydromethanopterin reductase-like flavin-dependent oxidoreductase (luciferase family)
VLGGTAPQSLARAVRYGHGWYGFNLEPARVRECIDGLAAAASRVERPAELGKLEITVTPPPFVPFDVDKARAYRDAGVDRLVPYPVVGSLAEMLAAVDRISETMIGRL